MARSMFHDDPAVFRTVITETYADGREVTHYAGPFSAKAPATAALTRARREVTRGWRSRDGVTVVGYVERAPLAWERVE